MNEMEKKKNKKKKQKKKKQKNISTEAIGDVIQTWFNL